MSALLPQNPARVVQEANLNGLIALTTLLQSRTNKHTKHLYRRCRRKLDERLHLWEQSRENGTPDFSLVTSREKTFRSYELENFWETTTAYGNTETRRVMSEKEGTVGPLNRLINIAGALLRDYFIKNFPVQTPQEIGRRKSRIIWGYVDDELGKVPVSHGADLPELDLADMIRSHVRELARQAFIHSVDYTQFSRYALLLIQRLSPFVEFVYTDGKSGQDGFHRPRLKKNRDELNNPWADLILRNLVDQMCCRHSTKRRRTSRLRLKESENERKKESDFFEEQVAILKEQSDAYSLNNAAVLKNLSTGRKKKLRKRDADFIKQTAKTIVQWEGTRTHEIMVDGHIQPFNLTSIIRGSFTDSRSRESLLLATEVPMMTAKGKGKADIVIFKRRESKEQSANPIIYQPIAVFEIKTRTGLNWDIRPKDIKSKRKEKNSNKTRKKIVPAFRFKRRRLTVEEWEKEIDRVPTPLDLKQLKLYEDGLLKEYSKQSEIQSNNSLLKGVFLIDSQADRQTSKEHIQNLLRILRSDRVYERIGPKPDRLLIRQGDQDAGRVALLLVSPRIQQLQFLSDMKEIDIEPKNVPIVRKKNRKYIVYLSVASASTSGKSAAWIAQFWHGLEYISQLESDIKPKKIVWLDLTGEFSYPPLAQTRLRLRSQNDTIKKLFERIDFIDIAQSVDQFIYAGKSPPNLEFLEDQENSLVIVSGWDSLQRACPQEYRGGLREVERILVDNLVTNGLHVLWFGVPKADDETSSIYHRRCLRPFGDASAHRNHVTDIVWNLPTRPYAYYQKSPMFDDLRVIVHHTSESVEKYLTGIPILENWSSRFWSRRSKKHRKKSDSIKGRPVITAEDVLNDTEISTDLIESAMDLIPWIDGNCTEDEPLFTQDIDESVFQVIPIFGKPSKARGVLSRLIFQQRREAKGSRGYVATSKPLYDAITHPRHYRRKKIKTRPIKESHRPPMEELMVFKGFNEDYAAKTELRRMKQVLRIFKRQQDDCFKTKRWTSFIKKLDTLVSESSTTDCVDFVRGLVKELQSHSIWDDLSWIRESRLGDGLRINEQTSLEELLQSRPQTATLYGNYFIILLIALTTQFPSLSEEDIEFLWDVCRPWILHQLGFREEERKDIYGRYKFHMQAIWSNLRSRVRTLVEVSRPAQYNVRYGQLLVEKDPQEPASGLFLEDTFKDNIIAGLWRGTSPLSMGKFSWTVSEHRDVLECAKWLSDSDETHEVAMVSMDGEDYLWMFQEYDWTLLGKVTLVYRKRNAATRIRGLMVEPVTPSEMPDTPRSLTVQSSFGSEVHHLLKDLTTRLRHVYSVTCWLEIQKEHFVVEFQTQRETLDIRHVTKTAELLRLLRTPLVEGVPLTSSQDNSIQMTWNPYQDIEYGSLSFLRPYVERKRPYIYIEVPLPFTCEELLTRDKKTIDVVIEHDEQSCPMIEGVDAHGSCWSVTIDNAVPEELIEVFHEPVSDTDISSLLKSREIFVEHGRYRLNISFSPKLTSREGKVFREARSIAREIELPSVTPGSFLFLDEEQVECTVQKDGRSIRWNLHSTITRERIGSDAIVFELKKPEVEEAVEVFKERLESFVTDYFGMDEKASSRVADFAALLQQLRSVLKNIRTQW